MYHTQKDNIPTTTDISYIYRPLLTLVIPFMLSFAIHFFIKIPGVFAENKSYCELSL